MLDSLFIVIKWLIGAGTVLALAMMVLVALPQSKLRDVLIQIVGWTFALYCGVYCISPDILPVWLFGPIGVIDDVAALGAGIASASAAYNAATRNN